MVNGFSLVSGRRPLPSPFPSILEKSQRLSPETKRKKKKKKETKHTLHKAFYESVMIQPQVHLRLPCYDFYFL